MGSACVKKKDELECKDGLLRSKYHVKKGPDTGG